MDEASKARTETQTPHRAPSSPLVAEILSLIEEKKGENTVVLDLEEASLAVDAFVLTEVDNRRQLRALAEHLSEGASRDPFAVEGLDSEVWAVLDFGDVVVHIFQREARRFYDLEGLWGEAG